MYLKIVVKSMYVCIRVCLFNLKARITTLLGSQFNSLRYATQQTKKECDHPNLYFMHVKQFDTTTHLYLATPIYSTHFTLNLVI